MGTFYDAPNDYRNYLSHHGIKGQQWGVKHGPPYPLDSRTHKAVTKGKSRSSHGILTYIAMKAIKAGVDAAVDSGKKKQMTKILEERNQETYKIDKKTGLKLKNKEYTMEDDLKACNPLFSKIGVGRSANHNCGNCSFALEARRRGFEVIAKLNKQGIAGHYEMQKIFPTAKFNLVDPYGMYSISDKGQLVKKSNPLGRLASDWNPFNAKKMAEQFDKIASQNNSRGILMIDWNSYGGHACTYYVDNNQVYICDPQTGKILKANRKYLSKANAIVSYRTDNIPNSEVNFEELKRFIES